MTSPARILSTALTLAITAAAAACTPSSPPIDLRGEAPVTGRAPVAIRVLARPEHRQYAGRFLAGAIDAIRTIDRSFGGYRRSGVVLVDPDWQGRGAPTPGAVVMEPVRWWTTKTAMAPELAAARAVARGFWTGTLKSQRLPPWLPEALAELTARRTSAALFSPENLTPGYAFKEARFFGGFVPRFVRIRVKVETDGPANDAYRAHPRVDMTAPAASESDRMAQIGKAILVLTTIERWIGPPATDDVVRRVAEALRDRPLGLADVERMASETSGQDLSWLFDTAFRSTGEFDYGIGGIESMGDDEGYLCTVTVVRRGDALFTGSSTRRDGPFERGRGMAVQATFADGQRRIDYWDGREQTRTFRYRSPSPIVRAVVDPDRVLALDVRQVNNSVATDAATGTAVTAWASRYARWVESLLLTCSALI